MYVFVGMHLCVWHVCMPMCAQREARSQCWMSSITLHLIFETGILIEPRSYRLVKISWLISPGDRPVLV